MLDSLTYIVDVFMNCHVTIWICYYKSYISLLLLLLWWWWWVLLLLLLLLLRLLNITFKSRPRCSPFTQLLCFEHWAAFWFFFVFFFRALKYYLKMVYFYGDKKKLLSKLFVSCWNWRFGLLSFVGNNLLRQFLKLFFTRV